LVIDKESHVSKELPFPEDRMDLWRRINGVSQEEHFVNRDFGNDAKEEL